MKAAEQGDPVAIRTGDQPVAVMPAEYTDPIPLCDVYVATIADKKKASKVLKYASYLKIFYIYTHVPNRSAT